MKLSEEKINRIILCILLIASIGYHRYMSVYEEISFDKSEAMTVLQETWRPLQEFNNDSIVNEMNNIIFLPEYIEDKSDLIAFFSTAMPERLAEQFFENLIVEDTKHGLTVNQSAHFPTIYDEDSYIFKAYIRKSRGMEEAELVIQEMGPVGGGYRRRNYYRKNENDEWTYHYFEGAGWTFYPIDKE
ncbi:hypothetical protein Amet_2102 [Alkaliphilus metalliredigens QYMF]|uniref:Uncharacterized protein n=1 Tax=Alkaliphilus metalliredigens (strain QYMF) TaxID=293826 RepID=A6TPZ4_ALKMQ|nr:hypothetical protein [Alkaliphilus metalliredigens]ABR48262.1 hypothetical protein Amet_2102 [Alkaliphilus metalliredigens QYMF]